MTENVGEVLKSNGATVLKKQRNTNLNNIFRSILFCLLNHVIAMAALMVEAE